MEEPIVEREFSRSRVPQITRKTQGNQVTLASPAAILLRQNPLKRANHLL
jgi:hypothetical protein